MVLAVGLPRGESGGCAAEPLRRGRGKIMDACFATAPESFKTASGFTFVRTRLIASTPLSPSWSGLGRLGPGPGWGMKFPIHGLRI